MSYNPFDEDADLMLYVQFGASMSAKAKQEARTAAIIWCLKQGLNGTATAAKVGCSATQVYAVTNKLKIHNYKMDPERAALLRAEAGTATHKKLAEKYGISKGYVGRILRGECYPS